ncbi:MULTISPECIES: pseudouridine synthase [unclassified Fusibacter]|uniref:pseudouridine synthase n=1 Tax=unclassified Fusibacter TaxID=2624464 RepID=UPI0010107C4E|nr:MULTISPECIES: pseudouridine synthase [unclassified Fusibacter]MCK8059818.1 pseudouridine synthase [Fusibacter sp. A2]NPE21619.1 pseudouridine synthase [Fusibacter sp. A1]RXV62025.1 pseudouridine synthase [Fusibacter sp. A1]
MRLNKYIAETGRCSRREADKLIEEGLVYVNHHIAVMGQQVNDEDVVVVDGQMLSRVTKKVYLALHKPVGIECTTNKKITSNIIDFVNHKERVFPVGRLDKNSEGLILLTNDGELSNGLMKAAHYHQKEYIVEVEKPVTDDFIARMSSGVHILDTFTRPCTVERLGKRRFKIILTQGLNRQIRRMCDVLGYHVITLKRVRIVNVLLGDLKMGKWRELSEAEVIELKKTVGS